MNLTRQSRRRPENIMVGDRADDCPRCAGQRLWKTCGGKRAHLWRQYCVACAKTYRPPEKRQREYFRDWALRRRGDPAKRAVTMWRGARDRARAKGLEFSISQERVLAALQRGVCEVTGLQFELRAGGHFDRSPLGPTIDRIDSKHGYTEHNVQIVCWIYNLAKSNWTHEDVMLMVEALSAVKIRRAA
jgi:hypothetical protein